MKEEQGVPLSLLKDLNSIGILLAKWHYHMIVCLTQNESCVCALKRFNVLTTLIFSQIRE